MAALIDSSVLIAAERGALDIAAALGEHRDDSFAVSAVTASANACSARRTLVGARSNRGHMGKRGPQHLAVKVVAKHYGRHRQGLTDLAPPSGFVSMEP